MGDLMGLLKAEGKEIADSPVSAEHLGELVKLIGKRRDFPANWPRRFSPRCSPPAKRPPPSSSAKG